MPWPTLSLVSVGITVVLGQIAMNDMMGHNASGIEILIEVRVFNSVQRKIGGDVTRSMSLPAGSTVRDVFTHLNIREQDVFLVWCNGRDITRTMPGTVNMEFVPDHGDTIAISGAVPYSWGLGSPVV